MLIKVFGAWLVASNILFLTPNDAGCTIKFTNTGTVKSVIYIKGHNCDEVAEEINRQIKAQR